MSDRPTPASAKPMRDLVISSVVCGIALYVLGPFAMPAMIGLLVAGGIAARRGFGHEQALRLIVPVTVILLIAGLVLSMLFVPTARMVRGTDSSGVMSESRDWDTAPTSAPLR